MLKMKFAFALVILLIISGCTNQIYAGDKAPETGINNTAVPENKGNVENPFDNQNSGNQPQETNPYNPEPQPDKPLEEFWNNTGFGQQQEFRTTYEFPTDRERALLPDCKEVLFTNEPVPMGKIVSIEPIGSVNPPEHALASSSTDTYIAVSEQGKTTETVPLYAPGNIWITFVQKKNNATMDPEDYVMHYAMCKDVFGVVDHLKGLSPDMEKLIENYKCPYGGTPGDNRCPVEVLEPVKAGTEIGRVGRLQGNFNFGTWDLRVNHEYPTPEKYGVRSLHSSCPFDYYAEPLKSQLEDKLISKRCGTVDTYVKDTLQGEWFYGNATNRMGGDWFYQLFFGPSNIFSDVQVISVGGVISEPLKWHITPKNDGKINRNFSQVKAGSGIYCYEPESKYINYEKGPRGKILVEVLSNSEIKAEFQQGSCGGTFAFKEPKTFGR